MFPDPIHIHILYRDGVDRITGTLSEDILVSKGMVFVLLLQNIFASYPDIEKQYPPGSIGFAVNDVPPDVYDELHDNDIVLITGSSSIKMAN
jgi:hypothetical protein